MKMDSKNIKYKTSTNYEELYELLKNGANLIGYISFGEFQIHSKVVELSYDNKEKSFSLGFTYFEREDSNFRKLCENCNLRFIPLNH